jgi:hypothetical protein
MREQYRWKVFGKVMPKRKKKMDGVKWKMSSVIYPGHQILL